MRYHRQRTISACLLLGLFLWGVPAGAEDKDLEWLVVTSDRFSLSAEYPSALFHDPLMTYGMGDSVWFGPNRDGASLMISATPADDHKPYDNLCSFGCPDTVNTENEPDVGAALGQLGDEIYYSRCVLAAGRGDSSATEMHCLHIIFPTSTASTYGPVINRMIAALK